MARLIVTTSEGDHTVDLDPGTVVTIGRDPSNRIPLEDDTQASRRHCRIARREGEAEGYEVVDLGSTNKTRVNGQTVMRRALSHGDVVEVGHATIRFDDPEEADRMAAAEKEGVCFLEWVDKDRKGERVLLSKPRVTVGRRESNTIVLDDRMASGHHCEIDRDVNGYTLRDLGSTNGTLVNGEPVTESLLSHGARVRIGNSRFVFKDPSMKDVEVELAQFDEDEGWGMMGDIDLARAPGSRSGLLLVVLLFLAAGAGGFYLMQQDRGGTGPAGPLALGLVENGDFEGEALRWIAEDPERVDLAIDAGAGRSRSRGLVARARAAETEGEGPVLVTYEELLETGATRGLALDAAVKGGDLVVAWTSNPTPEELQRGLVTPLERIDVLAESQGGWSTVSRRLAGPTWARGARLGIRVAPGARGMLDEVTVRPVKLDEAAASLDVPQFKEADFDGSGALDLRQNRVVLLTGATPIARLEGGEMLTAFQQDGTPSATGGAVVVRGTFSRENGEALPAEITWRTAQEGLTAEIACPGAAAVGLTVAVPMLHLDGAISVLGDFPPKRIPAEPGARVEKVEQTLLGQAEPVGTRPPTLIAFTQADDRPIATLELEGAAGGDLLRIRHWVAGETAQMGVVTNFTLRRDQAQKAKREAVALVTRRPVQAFDALSRVIQEYPFEPAIRDEAIRELGQLEEKTLEDTRALEAALEAFRHYGSREALDALREKASTMQERFLADTEGERAGAIVGRIGELVAAAETEARAWEVERALPAIERLERLVGLLKGVGEYRPVAALYARTLVERYGALAEREPDLARRIQAIEAALEELRATESVRQAMPPAPDTP